MGQYFNSEKADFLGGDILAKTPWELMLQNVKQANEDTKTNLDELEKIRALYAGQMQVADDPYEREMAAQKLQEVNGQIDNIATQVAANPLAYAQNQAAIRRFSGDIMNDITSGDIAMFRNRKESYDAILKDMEANKDNPDIQLNGQKELERWRQHGMENRVENYKPTKGVTRPNIFDKESLTIVGAYLEKLGDYKQTKEGNYIVGNREFTPERAMQLAVDVLMSKTNLGAYMRQQERNGVAGFVKDDGTPNPLFLSEVVRNPDGTVKETAKVNPTHPLAADVNALFEQLYFKHEEMREDQFELARLQAALRPRKKDEKPEIIYPDWTTNSVETPIEDYNFEDDQAALTHMNGRGWDNLDAGRRVALQSFYTDIEKNPQSHSLIDFGKFGGDSFNVEINGVNTTKAFQDAFYNHVKNQKDGELTDRDKKVLDYLRSLHLLSYVTRRADGSYNLEELRSGKIRDNLQDWLKQSGYVNSKGEGDLDVFETALDHLARADMANFFTLGGGKGDFRVVGRSLNSNIREIVNKLSDSEKDALRKRLTDLTGSENSLNAFLDPESDSVKITGVVDRPIESLGLFTREKTFFGVTRMERLNKEGKAYYKKNYTGRITRDTSYRIPSKSPSKYVHDGITHNVEVNPKGDFVEQVSQNMAHFNVGMSDTEKLAQAARSFVLVTPHGKPVDTETFNRISNSFTAEGKDFKGTVSIVPQSTVGEKKVSFSITIPDDPSNPQAGNITALMYTTNPHLLANLLRNLCQPGYGTPINVKRQIKDGFLSGIMADLKKGVVDRQGHLSAAEYNFGGKYSLKAFRDSAHPNEIGFAVTNGRGIEISGAKQVFIPISKPQEMNDFINKFIERSIKENEQPEQ
jgi:hypothetical protein